MFFIGVCECKAFGYVLNNPLLYTDPSGELAFLAVVGIAAAVGILTTAIANISAGIPFWHGMGMAAVVGAISGAISFGIGGLAKSTFTSFYSQAAFQAGAHGLKSGLMSVIEGGDFLSGFAAGAISSIVSSGVEALGTDFNVQDTKGGWSFKNSFGQSSGIKALMIASGGLSGGISSSIAGGSFWKGVREGLITSGLNHVAHMLAYTCKGGQFSSLKDYEEKISERISERIHEVSDDIRDVLSEINTRKANNKSVENQESKLENLENIVSKLLDGCRTLEFLLNESHGYNIMLKYGTKTIGDRFIAGRVDWGSNNKSLVIYHNNDIDVIIHEMVHTYDIISRPLGFASFQANTTIGAKGLWSEVNAWKMTYGLKGHLDNIFRFIDINENYIKSLGY